MGLAAVWNKLRGKLGVGDQIPFANGASIQQGGLGIEQVCGADYRLRFEQGLNKLYSQGGGNVLAVIKAPRTPISSDNVVDGFYTGCQWQMTNGTTYELRNDTEDNDADWVVVSVVQKDYNYFPTRNSNSTQQSYVESGPGYYDIGAYNEADGWNSFTVLPNSYQINAAKFSTALGLTGTLVANLAGKADFVRLTHQPANAPTYQLSGGDAWDDFNAAFLTVPLLLTRVSSTEWNGPSGSEFYLYFDEIETWSIAYLDSSWTGTGASADTATWVPGAFATGTPVFTAIPKTTGQFALVDDGTNPPVMWQNLGDDTTPEWAVVPDPETGATLRSKLGISTLSGSNTGDETGAGIRSKLGISTLSGSNTGDQNLSSYATTSAVAAGYQPLDSDLTAIAALTTTSTGRALLTESVSQTGTGALVRAASPTFTGTVSAAAITASGTLTCNGNLNLAAPKADGGSDVCILTSGGNLVIERKDWSAGGTSGNITLRTGVSQVAVDRFRVNPFGRILMGATLPTDDGSSAVQITGNLTASGTLRSGPFTVASLPLASTSARSTTWVTNSSVDRTSATIGNVVAGGGSFTVPVTCNGTDWRIL